MAFRRGHFQRALEEAIQTHHSQWPLVWQSKNPLHGGGSFNNMSPEQRVSCPSLTAVYKSFADMSIPACSTESSYPLVTCVVGDYSGNYQGVIQTVTPR